MQHYLDFIARLAVKYEGLMRQPGITEEQRRAYADRLTILDDAGDRIAWLIDQSEPFEPVKGEPEQVQANRPRLRLV